MRYRNVTRRNFIKKTALGSTMAITGSYGIAKTNLHNDNTTEKLPREVWVSCISQMGLQAETPELMVDTILGILGKLKIYQPDVICMPEVFPTSNIDQRLSLSEKLEKSRAVLDLFSDFASQNRCYVICPLYTEENGKAYNAAVVFDREGRTLGEYRKIHLTEGEIDSGLTPGPLKVPVFQTDFGILGIQICFDIEWNDGWTMLRDQNAELVFWPSAFAGGQAVNMKAIQHKYAVASSTRKNTAKLCDITGEVIARTGIWDNNSFCASINLEKAFLHTWPYINRFDEIRQKYGRKVRITNYHEEEWSIIESLSPEIQVSDILQEFELKTYEQLMRDSEIRQVKARH
jgi:beta-ureidopropionase